MTYTDESLWIAVIIISLILFIMSLSGSVRELRQEIRSLRWYIWYTQEHQKWGDSQGITMMQYDEYMPIHQDPEFRYKHGQYHNRYDLEQENEDAGVTH